MPDPGFCECGCGQKTKIATQDDPRYGNVKGQPRRFIRGHSSRKYAPPTHEKFCSKCDTSKPLDSFNKDRSRVDGLNIYCRECSRQKMQAYNEEQPQRRRDYQKKYAIANPERVWESRNARRARVRNARGRITKADWQAILDRYGHRCLACGATDDIQMDHVLPLALGGTHTPDNIQPLCGPCNYRKNATHCDYRPMSHGHAGSTQLPLQIESHGMK